MSIPNPRLVVGQHRIQVEATCPECGSPVRSSLDLTLTPDGRIDLGALTFLCERCYPHHWERVGDVSHLRDHPDAKTFQIGA